MNLNGGQAKYSKKARSKIFYLHLTIGNAREKKDGRDKRETDDVKRKICMLEAFHKLKILYNFCSLSFSK
jgi:hypothetical protein